MNIKVKVITNCLSGTFYYRRNREYNLSEEVVADLKERGLCVVLEKVKKTIPTPKKKPDNKKGE